MGICFSGRQCWRHLDTPMLRARDFASLVCVCVHSESLVRISQVIFCHCHCYCPLNVNPNESKLAPINSSRYSDPQQQRGTSGRSREAPERAPVHTLIWGYQMSQGEGKEEEEDATGCKLQVWWANFGHNHHCVCAIDTRAARWMMRQIPLDIYYSQFNIV